MSVTVPIYGFGGGGGAQLNFKVVGNPQPNNPKENTIWVDTDVKITRWIFSAEKPFDTGAYNKHIVENSGAVLGTVSGRTYTKTNDGRAAFAFVSAGGYVGPMLVSPVQSNAAYTTSGNYSSTQTAQDTVTYNGTTYYYSSGAWMGNSSLAGLNPSFSASTNTEAALILAEIYEKFLAEAEEAQRNEGTVWFYVGTKSHVEFNALKKNALQVYPVSAKQYVSGAWVKVEAMSWKNSEWAKWMFAYYADGEKNVDFTDSGSGHEFTATWDSDFLKLYVKTYNASSVQFTYTTDKQSIIGMQKISVEYQNAVSDGGGQYSRLFVCVSSDSAPTVTSDSNGFNVSGSVAKAELNLSTTEQSGTLDLDVSSLSGEYTVIVGLIHARFYQSSNSISNANITKIEIM